MTTRAASTRLIGRGAELAALEAALADAGDGRPSLVFVAGESGVRGRVQAVVFAYESGLVTPGPAGE